MKSIRKNPQESEVRLCIRAYHVTAFCDTMSNDLSCDIPK